MARKLPWAADGSPTPKKIRANSAATDAPVSSVPRTSSNRKGSRPVTSEPTPTPRPRRKRVTSRSPSSSPIRRPTESIPQIEPMRPYPDFSDDRYIMVEDEFEAVAKSFTAHLHAAEYDRLQRKARERPPEVKFNITANMPTSVKHGLERQELQEKQGKALGQLMGRNDAEGGDDGAEVEDLWSGTSLAGLMGEGESAKKLLVGLERLNSSTRAARGFGRGRVGAKDSGKETSRRSIADIFSMAAEDDDSDQAVEGPDHGSGYTNTTRRGNEQLHEESFAKRKRLAPKDKRSSIETGFTEQQTRLNAYDSRHDYAKQKPTGKSKVMNEDSSRSRIRVRNYVDDLDDFDESQFNRGSSASGSPSTTPLNSKSMMSSSKQEQHSKKEKDRKSRLDEVPLFLV